MIFYPPKKYKTYEDILGEYKYSNTNKVYINAIFDSNYKVKYKELIDSIASVLGDTSMSFSKLVSGNQIFTDFLEEAANYLGVAYNFSEDYSKAIKNIEAKDLLTLDKSYVVNPEGEDSFRGTMYLTRNTDDLWDLKGNEVVMNISSYNSIFNANYTEKNYKSFTPHSFTYKKATSPKYNNFYFEKEIYITALTTEKVYTRASDEMFLEFMECDIYCYALYFDNVENALEILEVANKNGYSFSAVSSFGNLYIVTRSIDVLGSFLEIIEVALLIACCFYLGSFGIRSIKSNIYEIGVIKSLGGSNKDIGKIFIVQNMIVGIGVILLSIVGMYIAANVSNDILIKSFKTVLNATIKSIKLVQFYPTLVAMDLIIALGLIVISSFIPTWFLRKVRPIDILKAKE